jgi:hypothetical protein
MIDVHSAQNQERKRSLISAYVRAPQFGLVLGAGVTAASGVPKYGELALRLLEAALSRTGLAVSEEWVRAFVDEQRELLAGQDTRAVPPEQVILFVRKQLEDDDKLLRELVQEALYRDVAAQATAGRPAIEANPALDAILTFCAARPQTVLAPAWVPPPTRRRYPVWTNVKVGGILTTNYDNLVESAFHTKYRTNPLKPVGRPTSTEADRYRRLIPVYHVHGYVGYRDTRGGVAEPENPELVIAEDDYFQTFYDPLGFGTYVAMSFLRRFPCLFMGCSMQDKNLRRFLFHLAQEGVGTASHQQKFALLRATQSLEDQLVDEVLLFYGVQVIWMEDFDEIPEILCKMYTSVRGVSQTDWDALAHYRWGDSLD